METEADSRDSSLILLKQGAEAVITVVVSLQSLTSQRVFESSFVGRRCVVKERFSKKYRHPILDSKLTLKRLNAEARCVTKARRLGVFTPVLYAVDPVLHTLTFEYVEGHSIKDVFLEFGSCGIDEELMDNIASQIGDAIGKLHDGGLVHGDLTTSNMLLKNGTNQLVLIDFGLSFTSTLPEDKAVDLYVLERAILSMHSSCGNVMDQILAAYRKSSRQWSSTLNKLAQVRQRGRKRTMNSLEGRELCCASIMPQNQSGSGTSAGFTVPIQMDPSQNRMSLYYVHLGENPSIALVNPYLDGWNYHAWSRLMKRTLISKNKFRFLDGSIPIPKRFDPSYDAWERCNNMTLSWTLRSVSPSMA
ncbi:EKC/KEOPS complex subunit bud32, partial [Mucuna pruriens]